jgi:hypothetical protein
LVEEHLMHVANSRGPALTTAAASPIALICALLRGEAPVWPARGEDGSSEAFLAAARCHGVTPLLDSKFSDGKLREAWPQAIWQACHADALAQAMRELAQRAELARVLAALAGAGIHPLILKGAGLAYSHYPRPGLRPRSDTDVLIPLDRREKTAAVLAEYGYCKDQGVEGEFASYQATWSREVGKGIAHHLDVHWHINNSQILAQAMSYDELAPRAMPLPALGAHARALVPVDTLLFACIHRTGHVNAPYFFEDVGQSGDRLIWLYDMHLLLARMTDGEQDEFAALAAMKKIKTICRDALLRTQECFGTPIPQRMVDALNAPGPAEPSARYFSGGRRRQMIGDFLAFDHWQDRARWLAEHAFPPRDYMRGKYPGALGTWLAILYMRRLGTGFARMLVSRDAGDRY